jgi:hypothetical protein
MTRRFLLPLLLVRFVDDVRSWQTVEPAIDFTAVAALAFALA